MLSSARSLVKGANSGKSQAADGREEKRMLTRIAPFAFGAIALVLAGCAGDQVTDAVTGQPTAGAGLVRGQVTDVTTGQPIVGATVTFRDATGNSGTVTTDEGGLYSFDGIARAGPVMFQVSALDYATLTVERKLRYDDSNGQAVENFLLVLGGG